MAKPKTIYSLQDIFTKFLLDTEKIGFLIPTYQRGYKWASTNGKGGQVDKLMKDLLDAYQVKNDRYYLQFLTLKEKNEELEVIDGQQRLTTLTILFCVIGHIEGRQGNENLVQGKLKYETRHNFIEAFIYNNINSLLAVADWPAFIANNPDHDNQDVYFIFNATRAIHNFIKTNIANDTNEFNTYLCNNVFLIVNLLKPEMNSEKTFINVNKGVKLNDEDLVKGFLITKLPLDVLNEKYRATDTEVNELRNNLGRQWDEIAAWASSNEITSFFKIESSSSRLEWLIRLAYPDIKTDGIEHPIFNYFDEFYRKNNGKGVAEVFAKIRNAKFILNDWFEEPEIANLLGYVLHTAKYSKINEIWNDLLTCGTKPLIIRKLKELCIKLVPLKNTGTLSDLNYEDHKTQLFNVFLLLDVYKFLPINGRSAMNYDYGRISSLTWSIEHIFPQNRREFKGLTKLSKEDLQIINEIVPSDFDNVSVEPPSLRPVVKSFYDKVKQSVVECIVSEDEKLYLEILLMNNAPNLHTIGNLALLVKNMNSELSNKFFDGKRNVIVKKVSEGKFVPYHTYDVFSKLVIPATTGLHVWTKGDIAEHSKYIETQIDTLVNYLTN